jgi:hypothetical protein
LAVAKTQQAAGNERQAIQNPGPFGFSESLVRFVSDFDIRISDFA